MSKSVFEVKLKILEVKSCINMLQQALMAFSGPEYQNLRNEMGDCLANIMTIQMKTEVWDGFMYMIFTRARSVKAWYEGELRRLEERERQAEAVREAERSRERAVAKEREEERSRERVRERERTMLVLRKTFNQRVHDKADKESE